MDSAAYAEFVETVVELVRVNDLAAMMGPRPVVPAQRSAGDVVAEWRRLGYSADECSRLLYVAWDV